MNAESAGGADGPQLPAALLYGATGAMAVLLLYALWRANSRAGRFLIFALWSRYILSAYHHITYKPMAAGLSGNALGSLGVLGVGVLTVDKRLLLQPFFIPIYMMIAVVAFSGLLNHDLGGALTSVTKYGYLAVVSVALFEALARGGERKGSTPLLWAFAPLLFFQVMSVALGISKASEADGSTSYIGGYNHEATFSIALATGLVAAAFSTGLKGFLRHALVVIFLSGIVLANYRTTILGMAPLVFVYFALPELRRLYAAHRNLVRFGAVMLSAVALGAAVFALQERFADLMTSLNSGQSLIRPPNTFSHEDQKLLSGRPYIWSIFIYARDAGTDLQRIFGFGPEAWADIYGTYPHNTVVSYLYEYGWVGVIGVIYLWASMFVYAVRSRGPQKAKLVAAHLSFFLLNMATMPHWQIEGNLLYALICGYTLYYFRRSRAAAPVQAVAPAAAIQVRTA